MIISEPQAKSTDRFAVRIKPSVRFVGIDDSFVIFSSETGRYLTVLGHASRVWGALARGGKIEATLDGRQHYLREFAARGLLDNHGVEGSNPSSSVSSGDIVDHGEFDHLILHDRAIDALLVGTSVTIPLPPSQRRSLLERLKLRTFFDAFSEEARYYTENKEMASFVVQLGPVKVRIEVPATNASFVRFFSEAFFVDDTPDGFPCDFTLTVFDDALGKRKSSLGFELDAHFPLGVVNHTRTQPYRVAIDRHTQTLSAYSPDNRECVTWLRDFEALPYWSVATPLRLQLSWIADSVGLEFLHSAAVMAGEKAILFSGPSGSGKSTLALKLAGLGFKLLADDFLLCSPSSVQSVYRRLKVHEWSARRVIPAGWKIINEDKPEQKKIIDPGRALLQGEQPIGAVVVPWVGSAVSLTLIDSSVAGSAMAPASLSGLLGGNEQSLNRIARLVSGYPTYGLEVTPELVENPDMLTAIIREISSDWLT